MLYQYVTPGVLLQKGLVVKKDAKECQSNKTTFLALSPLALGGKGKAYTRA